MKKTKIIIGSILFFGSLSNVSADVNMSWDEILKSVNVNPTKQLTVESKEKRTKEKIEEKYHISVDKMSIHDKKAMMKRKNLDISLIYRQPLNYTTKTTVQTWDGTAVVNTTEYEKNKTSGIGVSFTGSLDFSEIGFPMKNYYATVDLFTDEIDIMVSRRFQFEDGNGIFADIGGGVLFQTKDTTRISGDNDFLINTAIGYNFESWQVKLSGKYSIQSLTDENIHSNFQISVGYRF